VTTDSRTSALAYADLATIAAAVGTAALTEGLEVLLGPVEPQYIFQVLFNLFVDAALDVLAVLHPGKRLGNGGVNALKYLSPFRALVEV
jgi:hypothetical protein